MPTLTLPRKNGHALGLGELQGGSGVWLVEEMGMDATVMRVAGVDGKLADRREAVWRTMLWGVAAVGAFHVAFWSPANWYGIGVFLFGLVRISEARSTRVAFYVTLVAGVACYGPHLMFFWGLFGRGAIALWGVLALWLVAFVALARFWRLAVGRGWWVLGLPVFWTGIEYFRCEWNFLRFSWLTPGMSVGPRWIEHFTGVYGAGMGMMAVVAGLAYWRKTRPVLAAGAVIPAFLVIAAVQIAFTTSDPRAAATGGPMFVGIQLEEAAPGEIVAALDKAVAKYPGAEMFVLGEYSVMEPPPERILAWARGHGKYVILGGIAYANEKKGDETNYYDTAFVIGPQGKVVFSQAKAVPIQVMKDGLAAKEQRVWDSPWGKVGICICYDLSYRRVTDELIRQGAQVLVVPTMDAESWGRAEHELHARVAPVRAVEYGVPVFRVGTSGISLCVGALGEVRATAGFPGQGEMMVDEVRPSRGGAVPVDEWVGPGAAVGTVGVVGWMVLMRMLRKMRGP